MLKAIFSSARQCFHVSGHGVIATAAPRMTAKQSAESQIRALQRSVLAQCLYGILGTSGGKTTGWRSQGRDVPLIATDGKHQKCHQPLAQMLPAPSKECPHDVRFTTLKNGNDKMPETPVSRSSGPTAPPSVTPSPVAPSPAIQQKTQPRSNGRATARAGCSSASPPVRKKPACPKSTERPGATPSPQGAHRAATYGDDMPHATAVWRDCGPRHDGNAFSKHSSAP